MSNDCIFTMHVAGRADDVKEVHKRLDWDSDSPVHFARIKDIEPMSDPWATSEDGEVVLMAFYGSCAWSVESCMLDGDEFCHYYPLRPDVLTTLGRTACELDVDLEVYSTEPGCAFAEHYVYEGGTGTCLLDDTRGYTELWFEDKADFEENHEAYGVPDGITFDDLDDGTYRDGGFEETCSLSVDGWLSRHGIAPHLL